ncbi:MAG: enoyl-CoA hydratase/isomerase family protein [Rhodobiaceae bacterium]|nr:enoyl-CoA hydratase/isomerase family protein [Rhodobiaceae bacterium]
MSDLVTRDDKNGVAILTINRPDKLNALNVAVFQALEAHIAALETQTDTVGCVVLRGGGKCFSAGHDLKDIEAGEKLPRPSFQAHIIERLANLPQPVITAVHGHCYTGALELALAGDIILAAENAKFADTHAKWALTPVWGMSQRLPRRVGKVKAAEMMFTAKTYTGREAEEMGLCNICFPDAEFEASADAFCADMLTNSWFSLRANKKLLRDTDGMSLEAGLAHEIYQSEGVGPDMAERIGGFGKK